MSNCPSSAAKNKAIHKYFFSEAFFHTMEVFIKDSLKPKWNQDKSFMLFEWEIWTVYCKFTQPLMSKWNFFKHIH